MMALISYVSVGDKYCIIDLIHINDLNCELVNVAGNNVIKVMGLV